MPAQLNRSTTNVELFEYAYGQVVSPETAGLPLAVLKSAVGLSERHSRAATIAAKGIAALMPDDLLAFKLAFEIPPHVARLMASDHEWPAPIKPPHLAAPNEEAIAELKIRLNNRLNEFAEVQASRVLRGRERLAMTYLQKGAEASSILASPDARPPPSANPHLTAEAALLGAPVIDVARVVDAKANAWATTNAVIETARQRFQMAAKAAATVGKINAAYADATATIEAAINGLLSG